VAKGKAKSGRLSVFKGREARLNRAIFHILALQGPKAPWDVFKEVKAHRGLRFVRYASINKRVRNLEEEGYLKKAGVRETKAGFEAETYEITFRANLAILLDYVNLDDLCMKVDETMAQTLLAAMLNAYIK